MASKYDSWQDAVSRARNGLEELAEALEEMVPLQKECGEAFDNLTPGLQATERGIQFESIANVSLDGADDLIKKLDSIVGDAESC